MRSTLESRGTNLLQSVVLVGTLLLSFIAGLSAPIRLDASATLTGFGVTPSGPPSPAAAPAGAATPPSRVAEPLPSPDPNSDSVGAVAATYRTDESGAATYSAPIFVAPGTAGLSPSLSLEYNSRGPNGPVGPGWSVGGLSAITRCKKATEYGDGVGPFPSINFDGVATDQAYCLDGARLLQLSSSTSCPAGISGDTAQAFGLELDPSTRICGYTKPTNSDPTKVVVGFAYWVVQGKDGTSRVYGNGGNSALIHNAAGVADVNNRQYLSWAVNRIADTTGNTIELSYNQTATTGELDIAEIDYTAKIGLSDLFNAAPIFSRAAYAKVVFGYSTLPAASERTDYVSGMTLALTQQLTSITSEGPVNNGSSPNTLQMVRTYHLTYGTPTASGLSALTSLKECAPNGSGEACYPATSFTWNYLGTHPLGFPGSATQTTYSGLQYAIDYKVGDVDGDGRQDMVWVKDQSCDNTGSGSTRFQIWVSLGNSTGFAPAIASGVYLNRPPAMGQTSLPACGQDFSAFHFDTLWYLYDFSGDGRDDVLASSGLASTTWKIYPSISSGTGYTFDGAHPVDTGLFTGPYDDGIFADLNADGLPDLIHENSVGGISANVLQKQTSGSLTFNFGSTQYNLNPVLPAGATEVNLGFAPHPGRNVVNADLNGDGVSDFVVQVVDDNGSCGPGGGNAINQLAGFTTTQGVTVHFQPSTVQPDATQCPTYWYTFRTTGLITGSPSTFNITYETEIGQAGGATGLPKDGSSITLADLNGDGQADIVYAKTSGTNLAFYYRLNAGKSADAAPGDRFLAEQNTGLTLSTSFAEHVQFLDVNGDHRTDLVYQDSTADSTGTFPLKAMLWGATSPGSFGTAIDIGNSTLNAQDPTKAPSFFIDVDGNGGPDFVSAPAGSIKTYGYAAAFGGNDFITGLTNGLGASNFMTYYPLAYASGYTRAYDGPAQTWGRSSPVFDVFSAIWVVHAAYSTAPLSGNPTAQSEVVYRYTGAKIQAGGRGFLGFSTVQAENQQATQDTAKYLVTTTQYRQDFPFIGKPEHTVVELESSLQADPCNASPGSSCFSRGDPPCGSGGVRCNVVHQTQALTESIGVNGQVLSDAEDQYTSNPAFVATTVQPVMPYLSSSDEQKFDVTTAGSLSHEITSSFSNDTYGNVTSSTVISSESAGTDETKTTTNVFGCTIAPPTVVGCTGSGATISTEWQRLGRLSMSTVTTSRPAQTDAAGSKTRRASFEYDPTTLLRQAEIQGPYDDLVTGSESTLPLGLRIDIVRDSDGNAIEQVKCSTADFANRTACTNLSSFQQQQWPSTPTKIQRYVKWNMESLGRFELDKNVPFYSATATGNVNENIADYVGAAVAGSALRTPGSLIAPDASKTATVNRDAFGNPLNSITSTGNVTNFVYGYLGRLYFQEDALGAFARTTYNWCADAPATSVPAGATTVNCPSGGMYRVTVDSVSSSAGYSGQSVAPTTWSYYDALGREMLRTKRIYQPDPTPPSKLHWASVATTYDSTSRVATVSTPYFSIDPSTAQGTARAGTTQSGATASVASTTTYDAVDRTTDQSHPEEAANTPSDSKWNFSALTTNATNPRGYVTQQTKNARDEVVSVVEPSGQTNALTVTYSHDSVGNMTAVKRTPADGNSATKLITTSMGYDRLGRKTSMTDPDKGGWTYGYNALGEQISQTDAKGQTQSLYRDALGRLILRSEDRATTTGFISEPTSTWSYDQSKRPGNLLSSLGNTTLFGLITTDSNGVGGFSRTNSYDDAGRVLSVATSLDDTVYTEGQTYDQFGRPYQHFDASTNTASADGELTDYSTDGYPVDTRDASSGTTGIMYSQVLGLSERGQVTDEQHHENAALETVHTFDSHTGRMLTINTNNNALQNWSYDYDKHSNLLYRWDQATGYNLREDFGYDDLDRLNKVTLTVNGTAGTPINVTYDQLGNVMTKTGGASQTWTYASRGVGCAMNAGPHAASAMGGMSYCYDANGNQISADTGTVTTRTITYTGYDMPAQVQTTSPSVATESFFYAPDRSMWKRVEGASSGATDNIFCNGFDTTTNSCPAAASAPTTYFVGNVEIRISGSSTTLKRYIGSYLVITTTLTSGVPGNPTYAYLFRDVLGSIDVITNEVAVVQQRQSFDAWGNRRDASASGSWAALSPSLAAGFDTSRTYEGFTGHQQLDPVGLIHMKGRLYDASLNRFIQADSMVDSDPTQGLNRYSYVLNNPLSLTDPSGYLSFRQILGIAIAAVAAYFGQYELSKDALAWSFGISVAGGFLSAYVATGSLKAGLWGAFAAGLFWGIGTAFTDVAGGPMQDGSAMTLRYPTGSLAARVAAHAAAGGVLNELRGGNFGSGFVAAGATELASPAIGKIGNVPLRVLASASLGGTVSTLAGGKFANGAETSFFQELFNNTMHTTVARDATPQEQATYDNAVALCTSANQGLSMFHFGSEADAADWFSGIANPITAATGLEVGGDIVKDDFGYYLTDLHPSRYFGGGAVDISAPSGGNEGTWVAYDHTHTSDVGFSDAPTYWNRQTGLQGEWGDLYVAINDRVDGFVSEPNGTQFKFDYGAFMQARNAGQWTVWAHDYVSPSK